MQATSFINSVIDNRFRIVSVLGQGGMGTVFLAEQTELNRKVALKILEESLAEDEECKSRFLREGKVLASFMHPNIVSFYNFGFISELPYLAMEYLEGRSLKNAITEEEGMSWKEATVLILQLCSAMQYAHNAGVVHRDLKPNNIVMLKDQPGRLKLLDFGLASIKDFSDQKQKLTATGLLIGSVQYMSPEQCLGRKADNRSDIYALACIFYEMLSGHCPFDADSAIGLLHKHISEQAEPISDHYRRLREQIGDIGDALPPALELVLQKCLKKEPENRYQSMSELEADLKLILENKQSESAFLAAAEDHLRSASEHAGVSRAKVWYLAVPAMAIAGLAALIALNLPHEKSTNPLLHRSPPAKLPRLSQKIAAATDISALKAQIDQLYKNGLAQEGIRTIESWIAAKKRKSKKLTMEEDVETSNLLANCEFSLLRYDLGSERLEKKFLALENDPLFTDQLKCSLLENKAGIDSWCGNTAMLYQIQDRIKKILLNNRTMSPAVKAQHWMNNASYLHQCEKFEESLAALQNAEKEILKQGEDVNFMATIERQKAGIYYQQKKIKEAQASVEKAFTMQFENEDGLAKTTHLVVKNLDDQFAINASSQKVSALAGAQAEVAAANGYSKIAADMITEQLKGSLPSATRAELMAHRAEHTINTWSTTNRNRGIRFDRIKHREQWLKDHETAARDFLIAYEKNPSAVREHRHQLLAWRHASLTVLGKQKEADETVQTALKPLAGEKPDEVRAVVAKCIWATGSLWSLHGFYPECIPLYKKAAELYTNVPGMETQRKRAENDLASAEEKWKKMQASVK